MGENSTNLVICRACRGDSTASNSTVSGPPSRWNQEYGFQQVKKTFEYFEHISCILCAQS